MLKATSKMKDGRPLLILGLTGENITRMMAQEPVEIDVAQMGDGMPELVIVMFAGKTEKAMADMLRKAGLIGPDTEERHA